MGDDGSNVVAKAVDHYAASGAPRHVNDQSVVNGWAGYDAKVRYLPPEHFLANTLSEASSKSSWGDMLMGRVQTTS